MIKLRYRVVLPLAAVILAALLLRFPPEQYGFYPQCPVYAWTNLQCPGCGATRALAALLRGHIAEALHDNTLIVLLLPFLAGRIVLGYRRTGQAEELHWPLSPRWSIPLLLVAATVFTVVRNLPA